MEIRLTSQTSRIKLKSNYNDRYIHHHQNKGAGIAKSDGFLVSEFHNIKCHEAERRCDSIALRYVDVMLKL